jgi:hypothetical protein
MTSIYIQKNKVKFDKPSKTFSVKGKGIPFGTRYELVNQKTDNFSIFNFVESTGSEWDPNTIWKYENSDGFSLHVGNEYVNKMHKDAYLMGKLR